MECSPAGRLSGAAGSDCVQFHPVEKLADPGVLYSFEKCANLAELPPVPRAQLLAGIGSRREQSDNISGLLKMLFDFSETVEISVDHLISSSPTASSIDHFAGPVARRSHANASKKCFVKARPSALRSSLPPDEGQLRSNLLPLAVQSQKRACDLADGVLLVAAAGFAAG